MEVSELRVGDVIYIRKRILDHPVIFRCKYESRGLVIVRATNLEERDLGKLGKVRVGELIIGTPANCSLEER